MTDQPSYTYRDAGVDIDAGEHAVELMKAHVRATFTPGVLADLGTFGAMFAPDFSGYAAPVLVASTDSVGTKVKVAFLTDRHQTVGQDLVNHCINDILVQGARSLFFLDYFAVSKLDPLMAEQVVAGLSIACKAAGCALIGGETAELPGMYAPGEYDLAGFVIGIVDRARIISGAEIRAGDRVIGLASNGLHTNGYTLARKLVFEVAGLSVHDLLPTGRTVADELLRIHQCYAPVVPPAACRGADSRHGAYHRRRIARQSGAQPPGRLPGRARPRHAGKSSRFSPICRKSATCRVRHVPHLQYGHRLHAGGAPGDGSTK